MTRRLVLALGLLLLGGGAATDARGQTPESTRAYRFFVDSVADSTFVFRVGSGDRWLQPGQSGIAVDPRRRDALVARFRVMRVDRTRVTALVTGQTTVLTREHVVLLDEPRRRFYRDASFWAGTILGVLLGGVAALSF